jgi:Obg family GTPase CgtA-like protein
LCSLYIFLNNVFVAEILSDPAYPGQWRVSGGYIEQVAKMTHWEYPQAVERFGRQLEALGIAQELTNRGATDGDLVMVDEYDFDFAPGMTNPYIPEDLLEEDALYNSSFNPDNGGRGVTKTQPETRPWRPFTEGGYMDTDLGEFVGFNDSGDWDLLDESEFDESPVLYDDDETWTS